MGSLAASPPERLMGSPAASPPQRRSVALLTNFVPPYLVPFFGALQRRLGGLRIWVSTEMEDNRPWGYQGQGLPVTVQRTLTLRQRWRHPAGFRESNSLHLPLDTVPALLRSRPEVIVSTEFGARTLQALAYRGWRPDTGLVLWALVSEVSERGRGRLREALRRWILRRVDAVVVSGESGARYIRGLGFPEHAIFRAPYSAPPMSAPATHAAGAPSPDDPFRLLYLGQLVERKGVAEFLSVLADWARANPSRQVKLTLVGDGPERSRLEAIPMPPNAKLHFLGNASYEDLPRHYAETQALVFPTLADEWGVVVNEALSAGVPILGSLYSQAVEESVVEGETGWTFRPDHREEMSAALDRALSVSEPGLTRMRAHCLESAERLAPERVAETMLEAISFATNAPLCPRCNASSAHWLRLAHVRAWRCTANSCGLRFAAPAPDPEALAAAYRSLYYPASGDGDVACQDTPREILEDVLDRLEACGLGPGARILDHGCGRGALLGLAAERGWRVVGIEADPEARAAASLTAPVHESLEALRSAEPDARFDGIVLWQVIEHLRKPWEDLAALSEVLAPSGALLVATPNAESLRAHLEGPRWVNFANPTHLHYFTASSLMELLGAARLGAVERLPASRVHPHHSTWRRVFQALLRTRGLEGDLLCVARRGEEAGMPKTAADGKAKEGVRVTVCVASCRRPAQLEALLHSLDALEFAGPEPELQVVVADNDAAESARPVCESARGWLRHPLTYVVEPRPGIPQARNASLAPALPHADWIAFVDDDETVGPDWLDALLRTQRLTGADAVTGPVVPRFSEDPPAWASDGAFFAYPRFPDHSVRHVAYTNNTLVRAEALRNLGGLFDERLDVGEDTELFTRFAAAGHRIVWADSAPVYETVPPERVRPGWLVGRGFRDGVALTRIDRGRGSGLSGPLLRGGARLVQGLVQAALPRGRAARIHALKLAGMGAGRIAGLVGARSPVRTQ